MIFFKIVGYFANCGQGRFDKLIIFGSGEGRYEYEMIFSEYIVFATPLQL